MALRYFTNAIKKKSIAFLISDFMDRGFLDALKIASNKHDLVALRIYDKREKELPNMGLVKFKDAETGKIMWLDTASQKVRGHYNAAVREREDMLKDIFIKSGLDNVNVATNESYIGPLTTLFKKRGR